MKIGLAQINPKVGDISGNLKKILFSLDKLSDAEIVLFPELCLTGYPPEDLLFNKDFISQVNQAINAIAQQVPSGKVVVLGAPESFQGELYNAAFVLSNGGVRGTHRKVFLPNYDVFDEERYFKEGSKGTVLNFRNDKAGIIVCEDIWRPDGPAQWESLANVSAIFSINASPFEYGKSRSRLTLLEHLAKTLGVNIVYLNTVGGQDDLLFDGASMVISSEGKVIQVLPSFEESWSIVDLPIRKDSQVNSHQEISLLNYIDLDMELSQSDVACQEDLRLDESIDNVYKGLRLAIRDYVEKQGFKGVIVPVSGGIDSALVATLSVDALGPDRVQLVYLPAQFNSIKSQEDAQLLADNLGIPLQIIGIDSIFQTYESTLRDALGKTAFDVADENLQARIRANMVFYVSNYTGYLVLSCSNKSEAAVGYGTIYGDMAGGFAPIKDVLKTQVYMLANYRNSLSKVIPAHILEREPSAELNVNQRDQDVLPPYDILDAIIDDYMVKLMPFEDLAAKYGREVTVRVLRMIKSAEFKRKQAPIGPKISQRNFGKGWRMPVVNGFDPTRGISDNLMV
jgi:NAD+ synthase (glutamine-hydrolysing)